MNLTSRCLAVMALVLGTATACGLPEDGDPVPVALPSDFDLEPTTTTTTTLAANLDANQRAIYLIDDGSLTRRFREVPGPADAQLVIDALVAGLTDAEASANLQTRVPADIDIQVITRVDGVVVLNIRGEVDDETPILPLEGEARIELVGQLVLTAIDAEPSNVGVIFRENGDRWLLQPNADGVLQQPANPETGEPTPLTRDDFASLRPGAT